ncbi:MAG: hypothetical protein DRP64_06745 [Verrucomicrobia bacterium]|nr:MAG: hypothetical protein DRP64_06745 [Verrucomicrobiota bacterium]
MKRLIKKSRKVVKGMPSAVVLSILIHAALFLLAGMLVVFTVVKKEEKKFIPPKAVERPKMKLKKPKVKVKKTSKPKPTTRIVTKVNRASMPDIQLPEMSGMGGEGLGSGVGGFDMMPDLSEITVLGSGQSIGNDFVGTFYDFKRDRSGRHLSGFTPWSMSSGLQYWGMVGKFLQSGWKTSRFARYYRSTRNLYATTFVTPPINSIIAPLAFGDAEAGGSFWVVHYKGQLVCPATHTNGITFRFRGQGDDFLIVRVDGEIVLGSAWPDGVVDATVVGSLWDSTSADSLKYFMGNNRIEVGDWITLEPSEALDMEVLIGDWGGASSFLLTIEEEGVEYGRNRQGGPILPAFKTAEPSHDLLDAIYTRLREGELCMTNGPVFSDYDTSGGGAVAFSEPEEKIAPPEPDTSGEPEIRTWTLEGGRTVEAEFVTLIGTKAVLRNAAGKIKKVLLEQLSDEDREYIELACPPVFNINFSKKDRQQLFSGRYPRSPEIQGFYGVRFKQSSPGIYNHELQVEMFVIGQQNSRLTGKYILLDRQKTVFTPTRENQRSYEFHSGRKVVLTGGIRQGCDYHGYLVTLTDVRGVTVAVETSHKWLAENLENLKELKVGNYMDKKSCKRTFPTRPKKSGRY